MQTALTRLNKMLWKLLHEILGRLDLGTRKSQLMQVILVMSLISVLCTTLTLQVKTYSLVEV